MENQLLIDEIQYWDNYLASIEISSANNHKIYEIAFFKIYVKFERFLSNLFLQYSAGEVSSSGYTPSRRLEFESKEHVHAIIKNKKTSYIEYIDKIENVSDFIFSESSNPFKILYVDPYATYFKNSTIMRNHISHESSESTTKFQKILGESKPLISVGEYLATINRKKSQTNYSIYTNNFKEISIYLLKPQQLY